MCLFKAALNFLADGQLHSEKEISEFLSIQPRLVPETLQQLLEFGINLEREERGYCILGGLELLDEKLILNELGVTQELLKQLEILDSIESTNTYLLEKVKTLKKTTAVFAELQTAGRGQFNRVWISSRFAKNIALSILWYFPYKPNKLTGLSLAIGLSVVKALEEYGLKGIKLKWPNDIFYYGKKIAGVLIETRSSKSTLCPTVVGIGLNLYSPTTNIDAINQTITNIYAIQKRLPQRNRLAGLLLKHALATLFEFQTKGFPAFMEAWKTFDSLKDKYIRIQTGKGIREGVARGINSQGQFCIEIEGKIHFFSSEEIRIRLNHSKNC